MITAADLAQAVAPAFAELAQPGEARPVLGVELVEATGPVQVEQGDVVLAVGVRSPDDALEIVDKAHDAAALVLRRTWADLDEVRRRCAVRGVPLLAVPDQSPWSPVMAMLRKALEAAHTGRSQEPADNLYSDLFDMADKVSALVGAPVTVEDATSRVLAYSTGQEDVDQARMSTIVARRVPREVRNHFRSVGVFRHLARSDEPLFVPAVDSGARPRYVIPVRAGGEWLGSIWAVVDAPPRTTRAGELRAAVEVIALYLLRLRAHTELHRQTQLDHVRTALREETSDRPEWLGSEPWRVAALLGPEGLGLDARAELWVILARRHGWRQPVVVDLDGLLYAVLDSSTGPGGHDWFTDLVRAESVRSPSVGLRLGSAVETLADLPRSRTEAAELSTIGLEGARHAVASVEDCWPELVLGRALGGMARMPLVSPVAGLTAPGADATLLTTLEAVLDHWGEVGRAARALGVHPNTVRYRLARLAETCPIDLDDAAQRLAVRLEIARARADAAER
ncbi:DNA-binding PucR family transcriptional regulator [Nocardioides albertanoniae]|uniref:DNA-binding PucR family transcriptional regulator n=1 Tax=Nocardioides albertanoniae TaxID=1175486 RepID=A0A543A1U4_9ACTN|nr:PucR family transcriptional regulator [Nocardioides albertanoniae]TQL66544.1 DNA-binding PucR family transcriptional regulator [Nocardioides albertanoniae]